MKVWATLNSSFYLPITPWAEKLPQWVKRAQSSDQQSPEEQKLAAIEKRNSMTRSNVRIPMVNIPEPPRGGAGGDISGHLLASVENLK